MTLGKIQPVPSGAANFDQRSHAMTQMKTVLVTGANRGIGRAIAQRFAAGGHHVIVAARDESQARTVVDSIRQTGGSAETIALDVSSPSSIRAAAKNLAARHSHIDVLVNNAAINRSMQDNILVASQQDIEDSMRTNAFGPLELTKALLAQIKAAPGAHIVNVSSTVGSITDTVNPDSPYGYWDSASYRLSKSMLNAITGMLAKTLRADGIKVNAMCPGWTQTDTARLLGKPAQWPSWPSWPTRYRPKSRFRTANMCTPEGRPTQLQTTGARFVQQF
jgi:NAD(P)-dependent dehydrogenase (short-subunit alcohol dehydrogenase family)